MLEMLKSIPVAKYYPCFYKDLILPSSLCPFLSFLPFPFFFLSLPFLFPFLLGNLGSIEEMSVSNLELSSERRSLRALTHPAEQHIVKYGLWRPKDTDRYESQFQYSLQVQARAIKPEVGMSRTNFNKRQNSGLAKSSQGQKYKFCVN